MANRVLSVDMGYSLTKVCEMDYGVKNPKIYNTFVLNTPEGMISDGLINVKEEFLTLFQTMLNEKGIKTRKVIFSIASSKIATREAKIPYCKENRISDIVRANLSDYFPIDASQYVIAHSILGVEGEEVKEDDLDLNEGKKKKTASKPTGYKLLLLAAPKQLMESYQLLAKALKLEIVTTDYSGNSLYQAAKEGCSSGTQMIIKVDERSTLLMVLKEGVIVLNRTIAYGIDDAVTALSTTKELGEVGDYETTLSLARRKTCILTNLNDSEDIIDLGTPNYEAVRKEKEKVTESLQPLISGIARVIDYYNSNHSNEQIEKMYVTGVGADFSGLSTLLTNEIGFRIKNLTQLTGINIEKTFKEVSFGEYVTAIGAAIAPLTFYGDSAETGKKKGNINYAQLSMAVLIVGVVVGLVLIITAVIPYISERNKKKNYEQTIEELQPVYDTYVSYEQLKAEITHLRDLDGLTVNRNEDLVGLIEALESNMPRTFCLNSLSVTPEIVTLDVTVATKEEVAVVISELRKLPSFISVDTTAVSEVITEIGETQYSFTVEMIYAPIVDETGEVEE